MKFRHIIVLLTLALLTACTEVAPYGQELVDSYFLKVGESSITLDGLTESSIQVDASKDLGWYVSNYPKWLRVEDPYRTGSGRLTIRCNEENPSTTNREGTVVLYSNRYDKQAQFKVIQVGTYLKTDSTSAFFLTAGGSSSFSISTNVSWYIKSKPSWLTVSPESGNAGSKQTVTITAKTNPKDEERRGDLIVETTNKATSQTIKLTQAPVLLKVDKEQIPMAPEGGSSSFTITANASWSVSCYDSWCAVSPIWGNGNGTINVDVSKHTGYYGRTATINVTSGDVKRTIYVVQTEATLEVTETTAAFLPAGGEKTIALSSNTEWTVASDKTWCKVTPEKSTGDGSFKITAEENTGKDPLSATVTVKAGGLTRKVSVTQEGVKLSTNKDSHTFGPDGGSEQFTVRSNAAWKVTSDSPEWCSVSPSTGKADGTITISASEYSGTTSRKTKITIKAGKVEQVVNIKQEETTLTLTPNKEMSFGAAASSQSLSITSNTSWTVSSNAGWCTVDKSSGSGNDAVSITVTANPEVITPREATLTVKTRNGVRSADVIVKQAGKAIELNVSPQTLNFAATGDTKTLNVNCNTDWKATASDGRVKLSANEGSKNDKTVSVTLPENKTQSPLSYDITFTAGNHSPVRVSVNQAAATLPQVGTLSLTAGSVGRYEAKVSFSCTSEFPITSCGICYSKTNQKPTTDDSVKQGSISSQSVTISLSGLESGTTYYVRAYAVSAIGKKYSDNVVTFTTLGIEPGDDDNPLPNPK